MLVTRLPNLEELYLAANNCNDISMHCNCDQLADGELDIFMLYIYQYDVML